MNDNLILLILIGVFLYWIFKPSSNKKSTFDNGGRDPDCAFCGRDSSSPGRPCPDTCRHVRD